MQKTVLVVVTTAHEEIHFTEFLEKLRLSDAEMAKCSAGPTMIAWSNDGVMAYNMRWSVE